MPEKSKVTRSDIAAGLRSMGLKTGDVVLAHASLSAFGYVEGGADAVLDALLDVLGPTGTLVMPSHTDLPIRSTEYDPRTTPVRKDIGKIAETFWRRPGVRRGKHPPRHSFAAQGRFAEGLIALSEARQICAMHLAGILNAIADLNGYVLLLGCMHVANTTLHCAQLAAYNAIEGETRMRAEFLRDFNEAEGPLRDSGVMRLGKIGDAEVRLMRSREIFPVIQKMYATTHRGKVFDRLDYRDEPGFMPLADYPRVLAAIRAS